MTDYKGVLADLKAKLLAIERERNHLQAAILAMEALVSSGTSKYPDQVPAVAVAPRAFANLFMPAAIEKLFTEVGHAMTKREIQDALKAGGMRASAKSFSAHVYNTLHRLSKEDGSGLFYRQNDGRWGLTAWKQASLLENVS